MNSYRSWEDFLSPDDTQSRSDHGQSVHRNIAGGEVTIRDLLHHPEIPEELRKLLRYHLELEHKLKSLTGNGCADDNDPDAERKKLCYPVFVHTKQTRLEQRRQRRLDEQKQLYRKRALEHAIAEKKLEQKRESRRRDIKAEQERKKREQRRYDRMLQQKREEKQYRELVEERAQDRRLRAQKISGLERAITTRHQQALEVKQLDEIRTKEQKRRMASRKEEEADFYRRTAALEKLKQKRKEEARFG